jgi:hypothetical protein
MMAQKVEEDLRLVGETTLTPCLEANGANSVVISQKLVNGVVFLRLDALFFHSEM